MADETAYCIIETSAKLEASVDIKSLRAAVFVNLFYEDQVESCRAYLEKMPAYIDIIIISSKDIILSEFSESRYQRIKKKNRGRDISALLVAAKHVIFRYDYVCFIHDKKEKDSSTKEYVAQWRKNLWDNMLQSGNYVYNLLELLASDSGIGMLVPLPPHGKDMGAWLHGAWGKNYDNVSCLAKELGVTADLCYEKPPMTYSTVFWARTQALQKLYAKDWRYSDFPEEPMKDDGEVNHAIERILEYVVRDAGYKVKIALSASFASDFLVQLQMEMNDLWNQMEQTIGVNDYRGLEKYESTVEKMRRFAKKHKDIYLYGAGKIGKNCLTVCRLLNIHPKGVIVTALESTEREIEGIPMYSVSSVTPDENTGIIISVGSALQNEIIRELEKRNINRYMTFL